MASSIFAFGRLINLSSAWSIKRSPKGHRAQQRSIVKDVNGYSKGRIQRALWPRTTIQFPKINIENRIHE
jgi:hypothetical protein